MNTDHANLEAWTTMPMLAADKSCPLCGGGVYFSAYKHGPGAKCTCRECGVQIARGTLDEVREAWNQRVADDPLADAIKSFRENTEAWKMA